MERKYERKAWSKLYEHRAQVLLKEREDPASNRARRDLQMTTKAGTLIARKIGKRVRIKLKNKAFSCHRTPENLTFPKGLRDWSTHWGTQLMCSICQTPCFYDSTNCKTCNAIAHRLCVAEQLVLSRSMSQMSSLSMGSEHKAAADDDDDEEEEGEPVAEDAVFGEGQEGEDNFLATLSALGMDEYSCMDCQHGYQEDVDYFDKLKVKLTYGRRLVLAMRLVCRRILGYVERKRFKKLRKGLILIQSGIRKRRAKRVFFHWRRSQMRVIVIDILHLPLGTIKENDLVVLTAVDPMKNQQLFRIDKDASRAIDEGFLIPGITSHMTVVITLCRVEEHTANTVFVIQEQCQLSLRDIDEFLLKLPYALPFGKRIWWHPSDPKKDFAYRIVAEKTGGIVSGHSSTSANHGSGLDYAAIAKPSSPLALGEREHKQHRDAKSAGGAASAPDHAASGGGSKPDSALGIVAAEHKSLHGTSPSPSRTHSPAAGSNRHGLSSEGFGSSLPQTPHSPHSLTETQQAETAKSSHYVRVLYAPQNPISSMVVTISGPPLDVLRAPAVVDVHQLARIQKKKSDGDTSGKLDTHDQGPQGRATRWWLCLNNLRLYFYQNHGDIRPRFVSDIVEAQVVVDRTYTKGNVVSVLHHDSRLWLLELGEAKIADKFVFAVSESQKAHAQPQGSIFMRTSEVRKHRTFGFDFI